MPMARREKEEKGGKIRLERGVVKGDATERYKPHTARGL